MTTVHRFALDDVVDLARRAGDAILRQRQESLEVRHKADHSPVTAADLAADEVIAAGLATLSPDIPVISEERALRRVEGRRMWLVDPLDGTREFLADNGEYTVNIALIEDGRPVLGVVHAPTLEVTWFGAGDSAWRRRGAAPAEPIGVRLADGEALCAVASRSHRDRHTQAFLDSIPLADVRSIGSSLKFCLLAAGEADVYPRFGRTMEWDTAAGHAVLAAAGGSVRTLDGRPLGYGKAGFENPWFIARGRMPAVDPTAAAAALPTMA